MRPLIALDTEVLRANAQAWQAFAGVPLRAVVKAEGYGWGYRALVEALEPAVAAYCVADADELRALRRHTRKTAVVLSAVPPQQLSEVLDSDGLPTIGTQRELQAVEQWAARRGVRPTVRVGVLPAAGWSGLDEAALRAFAPALARSGALVEVWTHVTNLDLLREQAGAVDRACALLRGAGVQVEAREVAGTMALAAAGKPLGSTVRIGVGLFGASGGRAVPGVRCALHVSAPVVRIERHPAGTLVGYGAAALPGEEEIALARCGYADGVPKNLEGSDDILSVGMQYVSVRIARSTPDRSQVVLLDRTSSLDDFAARARRLPHDIVTSFGNAARATGVS